MINSLKSKPDLHEQQKHDDSAKGNPSSDKDNKYIKCWLCRKPHRLMDCDVFKAKSLDERKEYVKTEKLCFNCFSKGHSLRDCRSKYRCHVNNCNKKHHSSIHYETVSSNSLSIKEPSTNNNSDNCNKINQTAREKGVTHLQVLPINVSNGQKMFRVNALLEGGSDSTFISKTLADKLELPGNDLSLSVTKVLLTKSKISTKLVSFSILSTHHLSPINISNAWVVKNLNLPAYRMKNDFAHLKDKIRTITR